MIAIALPMAYFVREPPRGRERSRVGGLAAVAQDRSSSRPAFYFLMIGSMASIGAVGGTIQNLALYLSLDRKLPQVEIDTTLSHHPRRQRHRPPDDGLARGPLAEEARDVPDLRDRGAVDSDAVSTRRRPTTLKICAFVFGIGLGGDYMIIPLMAAELYGVAILGRVMGIVLTADSVSESLVPMLVASMRDSTGSYTSASWCSSSWRRSARWRWPCCRDRVSIKRCAEEAGR